MTDPIAHVVIVGGGTAGWMTAAAAGRFLDDGQRRITLVESDAIGTVGVGEATIPSILNFNKLLGIDEAEFLRETKGSFKLGIEFAGWHRPDSGYFHPFGSFGRDIEGINFHQLWLKLRGQAGIGPIADYSPSTVAARAAAFGPPVGDPRSPLSGMAYAYHIDATLYAAFLRRRAEADGVARVEGRIVAVERADNGHVAAVVLDDGRRIAGDLFIDCSGFRSLLLGDTLGVGFEDWSHWLPCDRAIAVPSERTEPVLPYTRATAHVAGWQWRIPLQHRTGNGVVYCSRFIDDDAAERLLLSRLDSAPTAAPRRLSFTAGQRHRMWEGNVVAIGLSGGFLEPLESTSIHLIQQGISKLFALFPDRSFSTVERNEYNRQMADNYRSIRDFIILHYHATARDDSPFWDHVRTMDVPDSLTRKLDLFRHKGRVFRYEDELFAMPSWVAVLLGQGVDPVGHDPVADALDEERLAGALRQMRSATAAAVAALPSHGAVLMRLE
ncbi:MULTISPECIES: tryptophan halogenase family protein [Sphingomonas]|jgi:tryptophan halogenase|uniref:Tryptophan halogenase n=1 Tax=Sphingomonas hankookensis TaxID=563996 RepID=A0ABR5YB00_9SPHN|nr:MULTISPECIES: tryptophan halogenase family protein [Sphingomonas]KZE12077.1 tryptophan halogenase [Sphingomonas hankookensis]PZT93437.1 MAG: tryptophan 7-halogenase [Sphingomonas sp.]RSV31971.1 tryptophan 7-halogenase [Sphingomonas sp. ABOLH]